MILEEDFRRALAGRSEAVRIALFGAPYDHNSSFLRGPADGPSAIRAAMACDASHGWTEVGAHAADPELVVDLGDLRRDEAGWSDEIDAAVEEICQAGLSPVCLGGDHAVTAPLVVALRRFHADLTIVHFDAHPDIYARFDDNPSSHASPFARIMECGAAKRLVSVGIRTLNPHLREQVERYGVEVVHMQDLAAWNRLAPIEGPVYVSFDLDGLDPSCAPGVSHWEPGGLTTRQALDMLHSISARVVGADVVELNPKRDPVGPGGIGFTAMVAAKIARELIGLIAR